MEEALNLYRKVIDCLTSGSEVDREEVARVNLALATAFDRAKVNNQSTAEISRARDAVLHLYEVL